ncbi:HNH endonuclease [Gordonia phage Mulch]|uniref:HNH endonuclease n=6 Tax=Betterkatzvirus betterkatz TaxID=2560485 RepID=A0A2Z5HDH1_9CAUD|nr:HNH endonuclease [Gordonia phage Nadeem]AZS11241.1 HNH endonuclease [Gordonia phage WheatThin]QAU06870.1 HNH endonuclease [Gordonia phage Brylie]QAX92568.1 HNH endonuclease [Gordonia phage Mulch]QAY06529.1 HNH endonuclease [Gordonia phage Parada]QPL13947.1 HNH endonuclease [Gordonia phage NancyRae]QXO14216.1 HNH endonuclease [Gordonia phage Bock]URP21302.1 HNH endonuclease [Gordonia phage Chop]UXL91350.1 HNH endonuclease [Gordonia phage GrandSlam]
MTRQKLAKTTDRGLGWRHQQIRRRLLAGHHDGAHCWWCGRPMYREPERNWDSKPLEADHTRTREHHGIENNDADRLLHHTCNRQRGNGDRDNLRPALGPHDDDTNDQPDNGDMRLMPWPW